MKVTVLGATGPTGRHVVEHALAAGHDVTVLVRDPSRVSGAGPRLQVMTGDATRVDDLEQALGGADAVLTALGSGNDRKSDIASRAARAIVPAAQATGVQRVVIMSAFGVGDTLRFAGRPQRLAIKLVMDKLFADKAVADELVRHSPLDWTLVYPVTLGNGPRTDTYQATDTPKVSMTSRISRADVADFMIRQLTSAAWLRRTAILVP